MWFNPTHPCQKKKKNVFEAFQLFLHSWREETPRKVQLVCHVYISWLYTMMLYHVRIIHSCMKWQCFIHEMLTWNCLRSQLTWVVQNGNKNVRESEENMNAKKNKKEEEDQLKRKRKVFVSTVHLSWVCKLKRGYFFTFGGWRGLIQDR